MPTPHENDFLRVDYVNTMNLVEELTTATVSFNDDGIPVSSVDLSKYGFSMPVIEPKPAVPERRGALRTVTFPHESKKPIP